MTRLDPQELAVLAAGLRIVALRALGDPDAAQDAVQETLARVLRAVEQGQLRDGQRLGAFAHGVARHVCVDMLRARGRHAPLSDNLPADADEGGRHDPLASLVRAEEVARVREALGTLSPADRRLLHLSFFEGLRPRELAARLREPAERLRKRKSRALERLREAFLSSRPCHESASRPTEGPEAPEDTSGATTRATPRRASGGTV